MELRDLQRLAPRALRHRGSRDQVSPGTYFYPAGAPSRHPGRDCLGMGRLLQGRGILSKGVCTPCQLLQALEVRPAAELVGIWLAVTSVACNLLTRQGVVLQYW